MTTLNGQVDKVNKSLKYSVLDGSAFSAMLGLTQNYVTPFALALRATAAQVGLLSSIPSLMMAVSQLSAPRLSEKAGTRKAFILPSVFLHALMWLPVLLIPYLMPGQKVWWLIAFVSVGTVFGAIANPAWGSMMADLVPPRIRGRYFATRGRIGGLVALVFTFAAGGILQLLGANVFLGFALLFGGAMLFRLTSFYFLARMYEPPAPRGQGGPKGLVDLVKELGSSNLGRFTVFNATMTFATNVAAPFFAVYMLRDLRFSYISYVIVTCAGSLTTLLFLTYWGRRADRAGNVRVIAISSVLVPLVPLLWLVSGQVWYLVVVQTFASFAWAGFNLANVNFVYDAAPPESRTRCIALFNATSGLGVCLGSLTGGLLASHLPPIFGYRLLALFAVSAALRGVVSLVFAHRIKEVRHVSKIGVLRLLFRWRTASPGRPPRRTAATS